MNATSSRVAVITGASRGIGRAFALGLARDGWNIVVAAKSVDVSEKLPGSIHTVAAEVEGLGAQALAMQVDVRDDAAIEALAERTMQRFGRIDLLINNAGALFWKPLIETPMKRFDLVMSVNARAAFACSRAVLPAMIAQRSGHIINMSPPLDLGMVPGRIAYALSKLGMTMLTHGLAEEVRSHGISVNSLWPVTIIESQASINHHLGTPDLWRRPEILVDCVRRIVARGPALTGRTLLDEDYLREEGVSDFSEYACVPGTNPPRVPWSALRG